MHTVTVYTAKACPMCMLLKRKLSEKNIVFEENQDKELMTNKGFSHLPMLQVDDVVMGLQEALKWAEEQK